jgi:hypothetical protein
LEQLHIDQRSNDSDGESEQDLVLEEFGFRSLRLEMNLKVNRNKLMIQFMTICWKLGFVGFTMTNTVNKLWVCQYAVLS